MQTDDIASQVESLIANGDESYARTKIDVLVRNIADLNAQVEALQTRVRELRKQLIDANESR